MSHMEAKQQFVDFSVARCLNYLYCNVFQATKDRAIQKSPGN